MLNDYERRALAELERNLNGDSEFASRMAGLAGVPPAPTFPAVPVLCALLFILVPVVMLLFGWPGVLIVLDLFAAAIAVVLIRRQAR
ncbi:hypothetical protein GCM10010168_51550 [Actinoplanes ianthinogenes]|uniref:DUF3040 domain-containing protein n=1 Tax=Actinoplanes ianthinogenes TaxID=122358 RepID=A0ABN6CME9_9ACTN|nr:DUF3040 domain-containing protein [Actinoplanes ianthinogenes]BCJ46206.1 hypothetical protein Aiant_68630 [Actinoplanes ianthinogenes]GGR27039.1 hypothetical protein GCM10010168_51550 [Actinoplanes ianthinogenes]